MRSFLFAAGVLALSNVTALADCTFISGPCSTDRHGNTYTTERNFGGGYTTRQNGSIYSNTEQLLGGGYRERDIYGGSRTYNHDPYGPLLGSGRARY